MLPSIVVALFLAIGVAGWTYSKITQRTGGNTQSDATVTAIVGLITFFIALTLLNQFVD